MTTLAVPSDDRRISLRSFWFALGVLTAAPWLAAAAWSGSIAAAAAGVAAAGAVVLVPLAREDAAWRVYRAWNRRVVGPFVAAAAQAVMRAAFVVVWAAGRRGSGLTPQPDVGSGGVWAVRQSLPGEAYRAPFAAPSSSKTHGWVRVYVRWARATNNLWAVSLLPFLATLRLLSNRETQATPDNIYTLF